MRYISRFKNSIRASSVYSLAFMLTFALAAGLTTYEEAAAQSSITLSADVNNSTAGNQTDIHEGGNAVTVIVTATFDGAVQDTAQVVTVKVAPIDTTRYTVNNEMIEITIAENEMSMTGNFQITPVNDGVFNSDLKINITGTTTPTRFIAATSVTLLDNDQDLTLSFAAYDGTDPSTNPDSLVTSASVAEMDAEDQEQEVVLHVRAMDAPRNAMDVPITVSRNNSRYSVTGDLTIEISAGDNLGKTTLKITPVDNDRWDKDAEITVMVGGGLEARPVKIIVRDMDETEPKLKIAASPDKVHESGADTQIVQVTATLDGDAVQTATRVTLAVSDDSDDDRYSVSGTKSITIPAGGKTGSTNLAFAPTKDAIFYIDLSIAITGSSDYDPDPKASDTVTLQDDDQEISLSVSPDTVMETDDADAMAQKVTITATLPISKPRAYSIPLDVATTVDNGTTYMLDPDDGDVEIMIDAGKKSGTAEITITPQDNSNYNKDANIMVSVADENDQRDNAGLSARAVNIKLVDNEKKPVLEIALDQATVSEAEDNNSENAVVVTATLKGAPPASGNNATIALTVTPADPASTRYVIEEADDQDGSLPSIPISGGGIVNSNGNTTLTFDVTQDGKFFQDLVLTLTAKADGYDTVTKTITVLDDDQDVTMSFLEYDPNDQATLDIETNVSEDDGDEKGQEVVVHAYVAEAPRNAMDVPIMVSRNSSRYSVTGDMTIEITAGDNLGKTTLTFTPVENDRFDDPEDITVSVGGGLNARNIKVVLSDDDETKPTLKVKASPDKVNEDGADTQIVKVTAELDGDAVQKATTVTFKVEPERAGRYSVTGVKEITIAAGSKTGSTNLAFVPVKDGIFHDDLDVEVTGSSDPDYGSSIAKVMIRDDDQEVDLSVSPSSVTETDDADAMAQKVTITATLPSSTPKEIMIPLTVSANNVRYGLGTDDATPSITIDAGDDSGTAEITITPTDNPLFNADENITVKVDSTQSDLAARSVAIKLTDDEKKPVLELAVAPTAASEFGDTGFNQTDITVTTTLKGPSLAGSVATAVTIAVTPADTDSTRYYTLDVTDLDIPSGVNEGNSSDFGTLQVFVRNDGKFFQDKVITLTAKAEGFDSVSKTVTIMDDDQDITLSFAEYGPNVDPPQTTPVAKATVSEAPGDEEAQEVVVWAKAMEAPRNAMDVPITVTRNSARYSVTGDMTIEIGAGDLLGKTTLKITPVENDRFDAPEDIVVSVGGGLNARDIKVSLTDLDEKEPKLKVAASPKQVDESGADTQIVQVTATLDGDAVQKATTVTFEVKPESESRYGVTGDLEVVIPAGSKAASTNLSFVPVKDGIFNQDLPITITGKADPNYNPEPAASATVTLRDDDQEITLSVSPATVTEAAGDDAEQKVKITATMDNRPARKFSVPLMIADGDRHNVSATLDTITIEAGNTSGSTEVTITTQDNGFYNADENITVMVDTTGNLAARPVDIKYVDDEKKPVLELTLSATTVSETVGAGNDNQIAATATLKGPSLASGVVTAVTFKLEPADSDSVRYNLDGGNQENTLMMNINPGSDGDVDTKTDVTFNIDVTQDGKFYQDKVLTITASAEGFDAVSKTVTILDDDQDVTLSFADYDPINAGVPTIGTMVMEMDGEEEAQEVVVWVRAMDAPPKAMDVPISVSRNSSRYSVTGDMTIEIAADEISGKTTLKITPVENDLFDDDEKIVVSVGGGLNARDITVTLVDADEDKPALALSVSSGTVTEGSGDQVVTVTGKLDGDAVQKATTVTLTVEEENADRYSVTGTMEITIPAGSKSGTTDLTFTAVEDVVFNPDLVLMVTGKSAPDYGTDTTTVTIADNDQEIMLSADPTYITEDGGDDQKVTITAMVTGDPPKQNMDVPLSILDNQSRYMIMVGDGDTQIAAAPVITIKAGARSGEVTRTFSVMNNKLFDGSIDIPITITTTSPLTARGIKIRLIDDEETYVTIAASVSELMEAGGETTEVEVTATLSGKLPGTTTVALSKTGTATKGVDYTVTGEGTIDIGAGETEGSTTLMITPVDDFMAEGEGSETIVVGGSAGDLRVASTTITLIDNNLIPLEYVMVDPNEIGEADSTGTVVTIMVKLMGTSSDTTYIGLDKSMGTATPGDDFTVMAESDEFMIAPGDSTNSKMVTITPVNDEEIEGQEEILVAAWAMNGEGVQIGETVFHGIVLHDDDGGDMERPLVSLSVDNPMLVEGVDQTITITATANGTLPVPQVIALVPVADQSTIGLADAPALFAKLATPPGVLITILPNETTAELVIPVMTVDDMVFEGDEVGVLIGSILGTETTTNPIVLTLLDNDAPTVTLTTSSGALSESGGAQQVTIAAEMTSGAVTSPTMISLAVEDGTATSADYSSTGGVITIPAGMTSGSGDLSITVTDDDAYEPDNETIMVTAGYRTHMGLADVTLTIEDNFVAPAVISGLPGISLEAGDSWTGDVASSFSGKALAYSALSAGDAASAEITGSALSITGERKGSARVTVTATNAAGNASFEMDVSVTAIAAEKMVYTDILAAMGRNMMSSVSQTIGGRFSVNAAERQIALANRRVNGMASSMETLISLTGTPQATTKYGITDENSQRYNRQQVSTRELMRGSSFYYALDDAPQDGMGGSLAWTIWGAGDWNAFEGAPTATSSYDGTLTSGYVGLDVSKTATWIAGVAVGRTMGTADYDVTVTDGTLETTLNSIYPYVHWTGPGCCIEVWGIGGFGTGEAEANAMTSDLSMSLGMVGLRAQLVGGSSGSLDLDLIGDAGITKLSTSDSESASLSDLEASVQRVRIGLEASRTSDMGNGMLVTPFAQVAGRYDGGDGQTGNGLEVAGGLRIAGGRAGLEARGRLLAMHTGDDVKEHGVSVVAYVRPMGSGGQGLSMSLAPRMGADTEMTNNMWREEPTSDVRLSSRSGAAVKAEIGYGLVHPMMSSLLVTPFGTMDMAGDDQRRMRLGARFGSIGTSSVLSFELAGERIEGSSRTTDHRIGLLGRMSF